MRGFKIGENQSPKPQDRFFYSFNFFADLNAALNRRFEAPVSNLRAYREIFGIEKTFDAGRGSIGFRLPLNTLTANSAITGKFNKPGGTSTSLGDLSIFTKYIFRTDPRTGSLISAGLVVTPPTGPDAFAGAKYIQGIHSTSVQPFIGYILRGDRLYLQGFTALDVPSSLNDVTVVYNDLGLGYFLYRNKDPRALLSLIAPTFEVHVNTPLTHRDVFNSSDVSGSPDVVNLTAGVNVGLYGRAMLTFGFVNPVTGPRPFDYEVLLLFNCYFGRTSREGQESPPILGG